LQINKIVVAGGTGFIGSALVNHFAHRANEIVVLTRNSDENPFAHHPNVRMQTWQTNDITGWAQVVNGADAIINCAGASIAGLRWTKKKRRQLLNSRIQATQALVEAVRQASVKPNVVLQTSAIGIYGENGSEIVTESSKIGTGFMSEVVQAWEEIAVGFIQAGVRTVTFRTGVVLGEGGGSLPLMTLAFRLFAGGHFGSGEQWLSWIHLDDLVRLHLFAIENETFSGIVNAVAPNPVQSKEFFKTISQVLHRPKWFNIPAWLIKLAMGEMGERLLLESIRVAPDQATAVGFTFHYPEIRPALSAALAVK